MSTDDPDCTICGLPDSHHGEAPTDEVLLAHADANRPAWEAAGLDPDVDPLMMPTKIPDRASYDDSESYEVRQTRRSQKASPAKGKKDKR